MISIDSDDISPGKFYPNQNTNLNNFRTRGFLWEDGKVGERNWWVPKNWKSEKKKSQANASIVCFQMTSWRPYLCPKPLWELNSFFM